MKERLDVLLVKRGLAESREKAKAVIMSGIVYVDGQKEDKAGTFFGEGVQIEVRGSTLRYVSRGGLKLERRLRVSASGRMGRYVWTWARRPADLQTACCKTALCVCIRWT